LSESEVTTELVVRREKMGDNRCIECGHEWRSRGGSTTRQCPSCKTRKWSGAVSVVVERPVQAVATTGSSEAEIIATSIEDRWKVELEIAWERLREVIGSLDMSERVRREYSWWIPITCMNCGKRFRLVDMAEEARGSGRCSECGKSYARRGQEVPA